MQSYEIQKPQAFLTLSIGICHRTKESEKKTQTKKNPLSWKKKCWCRHTNE